MNENKIPIPGRIYNAAVGGHVTGADQIIDDETGLTLDKVAGGALEEKEYISGSNNGMGRVVLRKNLVNGVNTLTQTMINKSNTIYVIQYDFTLDEDITVPANCVLEFDGGSIDGNGENKNTIIANNTSIIANPVRIFGDNIILKTVQIDGNITKGWNIDVAYTEWFGASTSDNDLLAFQKTFESFNYIRLLSKTYYLKGDGTSTNLLNINGGNTLLDSRLPKVIEGDCYNRTKIFVSNITENTIVFNCDGWSWYDGLYIKNVEITNTDDNKYGIAIKTNYTGDEGNGITVRLSDLYIKGFDKGIYGAMNLSVVEGITVYSCNTGIHLHDCYGITLRDSSCFQCTEQGIRITYSHYVSCNRIGSDWCVIGLYIERTDNCTFTNLPFEMCRKSIKIINSSNVTFENISILLRYYQMKPYYDGLTPSNPFVVDEFKENIHIDENTLHIKITSSSLNYEKLQPSDEGYDADFNNFDAPCIKVKQNITITSVTLEQLRIKDFVYNGTDSKGYYVCKNNGENTGQIYIDLGSINQMPINIKAHIYQDVPVTFRYYYLSAKYELFGSARRGFTDDPDAIIWMTGNSERYIRTIEDLVLPVIWNSLVVDSTIDITGRTINLQNQYITSRRSPVTGTGTVQLNGASFACPDTFQKILDNGVTVVGIPAYGTIKKVSGKLYMSDGTDWIEIALAQT